MGTVENIPGQVLCEDARGRAELRLLLLIFIRSSKYLLSVYYVVDIAVGVKDTGACKTEKKVPPSGNSRVST